VAERTAELEQLTERLQQEVITNRNAATEAREAKQQAELASRAKSEFLHNMSHALRTPLNAIIGFSEFMLMEVLGPVGTPKYRDYVKDIHGSGMHLLEVINDILDLSKVEAGKLELCEKDVGLAGVVDACFSLVEERARLGELKLEHNVPHDLPRLHVDPCRLKQILLSLLANAIKFTLPGGTVMLGIELGGDGAVVITVSDTGIGIADENMNKVMEPFGQADSSLSRKYEGTGLGLPLVRSLVELHGGQFELKSIEDVGTIATVRLPAVRVLAAPMPTKGVVSGVAQ
jgi:signal transduction histidine kinase